MKQFSGLWPDIARRAAGDSGLLERLVQEAQPQLDATALIPQTGIASWNLYYFCPPSRRAADVAGGYASSPRLPG
ncbi:Heparinase II/III [Klebsiella oxytoca]|nr:Heparinase II/III [Klebsiella oxytoca]